MNCSYCRSWNSEDEHRCRRCGRRLSGTLSDTVSDARTVNRVNGNLAAAPMVAVTSHPASLSKPGTASPEMRRMAVQASLFPHKPVSKVIPFESYTAGRAEPATRKVSAEEPAMPAGKPAPRRNPATQTSAIQPTLDFLQPAAPAPRTLKTTVEAVIYCDAPVATPIHRAVAFSVDLSMVLIGFGMFLGAFYLGGGEIVLNRVTIGIFGASFLLLALFYGFLWLLVKSEPFGMHATHLRLTNFDGFPPDASQRTLRFAGTCLSLCSAGLGLLWALADEESLTWQDHISKTFPTLRTKETSFVRKR